MAMLTAVTKPCLVKKMNPLDVGGLTIAGWVFFSLIQMNLCGVINFTTGRTTLSILLLVFGILAIGSVSFWFWWKIHKRFLQRREAKKSKVYKGVAAISDYQNEEEE